MGIMATILCSIVKVENPRLIIWSPYAQNAIGEFKPEYVGKINLYLEALDCEVKKENENPSVGIILCASKDDDNL